MSNENSTTNKPLRGRYIRRGSNANSGRVRKFSLITYLPQIKFEVALLAHMNQIRSYAYIYHDKDVKEDGTPKEPHLHLLLVTHNNCTVSAVKRWFKGTDEKGMEVNTLCEIPHDIFELYDYLTHSRPEDKALGKYQYDKSLLISNDYKFFEMAQGYDDDNILLACESLLNGANVRDLGKRYGRDFILHFPQIKNYVNAVQRFEKYNMTLEDILDREYEMEIFNLNEGKKGNGY